MLLSVEKSIEVADIARKLGLDSSYFIRVFKRVTGTTPLSYFLGLKMDTAKHLLLDGSRTVRSVAELLGFQDELYFSRLFKRRIGVSPSAYRSS
jgi:AraC-like DNA-binding protein